MLQLAQRRGDIQRVGHHHQAVFVAELRNHRRRGGTGIDDDPRMLADAADRRTGDGLLPGRNRLAGIGNEFLRQRDGAAIAAQQQAILFQRGEILADGDLGGLEAPGELVDADFALFVEQGENGMAALRCVALRHR